MNDITVLIKTNDRFKCLDRLLKSLFKFYPNIKVLIADDGRKDYKEAILKKYFKYDITYYVLDYDMGLSYGRNFLLKKVKTPYFLLCDDDFVFDKKTNIVKTLNMIKKEKLDILGGYVRNYKTVSSFKDNIVLFIEKIIRYELPSNYIGSFEEKNQVLTVNYRIHDFPDYEETDIVLNFFIGRTNSIKKMGGWDNNLKLQEHTEFFYRAKLNKLKVAFTNSFSVKHMPVRLGAYKDVRERDFTHIFMKKYNFKKMNFNYDDKSRNVIVTMNKRGNITRKRQE